MTDSNALLHVLLQSTLMVRLWGGDGGGAEVQGGGYEPKRLERSAWIIEDGTARSWEVVFRLTGPVGVVRGWWLTDASGGHVLASANFANGPYEVGRLGGTIRVRVTMAIRGG